MKHTTPPRIDSTATIQIITPGGLIINIREGDFQPTVDKMLAENTRLGDTQAAIAMAHLTRLDVTIHRTTQTTVLAADLED